VLAVSAPALAAAASPAAPSPESQCRTERSAMGVDVFRQTYGTNHNRHNAFGKCVSKRTHATEAAADGAKQNASQECRAEEAADPAAFAQKYGTGKKGANAHGKCVSQKARSGTANQVHSQVKADINAAKTCKQERKADPQAFADKYGTNANKRNAFGKCVSQTARTQPPS
jgi:hypothetical protein